MPTVVIAPDSFKGSLSAREVAQALADGWKSERPHDTIVLIPQADGGEGTLDAIEAAVPDARRRSAGEVTGPDGRGVPGYWLELDGGVGVVELAVSSGLPLMGMLDPLRATTRGVGEVIAAALDAGARRIIIGLGGSASTDGGAGALAALGLTMVDEQGDLVPDGGRALLDIVGVDPTNLRPAPADGVVLLSDVTAPLLGSHGAAAVFGPQKGATPEDIVELDAALAHFSRLLGGDPTAPGSGAAGGAGYGFAAGWGATITAGSEFLAELSGLPAAIASADVLLTGEGRFDSQSLGGKVVGQLLELAHRHGLGIGVIAGQVTVDTDVWTASLTELAGSVDAAIAETRTWLVAAGARAAAELV